MRRRCHSGPDILCVAGPSLTCSVVLVIRVRAVKAGFSAEAGFTSVGAGPGPQGCPRAALLKAQDGRPLPQTRSITDGLGAWEILSHVTDPIIVQMRKMEAQRGQGTHSGSHSMWASKLRPDPVSSDSPVYTLVTSPAKTGNRAF